MQVETKSHHIMCMAYAIYFVTKYLCNTIPTKCIFLFNLQL